MTPASLLPIEEGNRVLDLCAAPGGKTTELGARLKGKGVLVCNDISNSRAKALLKNVELFGIRNAVVISEAPDKLAEKFDGYFDRILVDAPCSGEGMFRKSHAIVKNWEQYGVDYYAKLQRQIMPSAIRMLKPGGYMIFSTCTFSPEEDEGTLDFICGNYPEMEVVPAIDFDSDKYEGFAHGYGKYSDAIRIFPHKVRGEGHFVALLHKKDTSETYYGNSAVNGTGCIDASDENTENNDTEYTNRFDTAVRKKFKAVSDEAFDFLEKLKFEIRPEMLEVREERLYLLPSLDLPLKGLRILRTGLLLGEMKKGRFEPSQALASSLKKGDYENVLNLSIQDERVVKYLKCDTIDIDGLQDVKDGWALVMVDGYSLGWGKVQGGRFKNKYLPGWRML